MNTAELDSYRLADAVKFNKQLNPRLWQGDRMLPQVREKLLEIAADFKQSLGLTDLEVKDITVSGSNAGFTYTPHSDIDLHLVVDIPQADVSDVYRELFDAKKYQYNAEHNITIGGHDVELYVENANVPPVSQGVYSIMQDDWINIPKRRRSTVDDDAVRSKYADIKHRILQAVDSKDHDTMSAMAAKIKKMRTAGLAQSGEMGPENLAYKMLRTQGLIKRLYDARTAARDLELSLTERRKKKKRVRYAYGGYWAPGFAFGDGEGGGDGGGGGESIQEVSVTPDGVSPSTKMFLEQDSDSDTAILKSFARYVGRELGIKNMPKIRLKRNSEWAEKNGSFGQYVPELNELTLSLHGRHIVDVLRTLAHELTHAHQQQTTGIPDNGGDTGSEFENEANARAGEFMRHFADAHPEYFDTKTLEEGMIKNAGAAVALAAAMAMTPAQAQQYLPQDQQQQVQQQGQLSTMQILNIARTIHSLKHNLTRAGAEEEINQEVKNYIRATQGDPGAQNLSRLWQLQQRQQQKQQPQQQPWTGNQYQREGIAEASGYIPTAAEKNDPRFVMALSPDVRPGATGKNANKMALKTDSQGRPALLMKTANLREGRMPQPSQGPGKYRELNQPLGPESPPTMPAGTVRIDVSDMYDWYKLGQHISNMKGLGRHDFGAGPPSSIISFGDEETEHKFIKDLEATGLDVTDIDPKDPKQPPGMPKIKTDPTYNVAEDELVESLRQEFALLEDEFLGEIKMTGKNLRAEAAKTGALAGMEFEMIVPNTEVDVEPEYEPDWDMDQRTRNFRDIRDFFHDGDYNGRRDVDNLMEELSNEYEEWIQEQISEEWERDGVDFMRDFIDVNDLFDRDEAMAEARDEVMTANPDLPQESEDFQKLVSARIDELQEQFVLEAFEDRSGIYNDAFGAFAEEQREEYDEGSFLDSRYQTMSDIQSNFDISWPHYYDINDGQDGELDIDQVADDFSNSIGKPVNASRSYHGARREAGHYVVEPDGSLEGDNPGDGGLEFVSPPMPIDEMLSDLNKVKEWAGREGCYTNDSTGLHINISVPDYSIDKLDYVKLAILMGDKYILDLFGRTGNTYAKSAMGKIKSALQQKPEAAAQIMDLMKQGLDGAATKAIHSGITDKYTSINTKTGYIEFRSPGGDWLDENFDKIENTLLRFTVALSAAINPEAYRKEYLTKLYKLLSEGMDKSDVDVIQLFSNYSAGELDKPALIRQVRQKQLARNVAKGKATGKMWWKVSNPANSFASIEVVADNAEEAIASAILPGNYPDWARVKNTLKATPLRPYEAPKAKEPAAQGQGSGNWGIWIGASQRFARQPNTIVADNVLRRFPSREAAEQFLTQTRAENPQMRTDVEVREIEPAQPQEYEVFDRDTGATVDTFTASNDQEVARGINNYRTMGPHNLTPEQAEQRYGLRRAGSTPIARTTQTPGVPQGGNTGNWGVWVPSLDRYATIGNAGPRRFDSEADAQAWIQDYNARHSGNNIGLVAREVAAAQPQSATQDDWSADFERRMQAGTAQRSSYELYRRADGRAVTAPAGNPIVFQATDPDDAANKIARYVADFNLPGDPTNYDVRSVLQPAQQDAAQGGTVDVAGEQPAAPQAQQEWTGAWLVLDPNGRVLQRFTGIGNVQADANRHAMNWLRSNPRHMQAGVTVAPEMA